MGQAADPVDGRADLRLAGQVPPPEQGPREERPVVGIVHQAGHDPVDVSPASPLRCGRRIPLSRCSLNRPYGTVTKLPNAAPRRSRFIPATYLICLHAKSACMPIVTVPATRSRLGGRGNNASSLQFVLVGPRTGMLQSCG